MVFNVVKTIINHPPNHHKWLVQTKHGLVLTLVLTHKKSQPQNVPGDFKIPPWETIGHPKIRSVMVPEFPNSFPSWDHFPIIPMYAHDFPISPIW